MAKCKNFGRSNFFSNKNINSGLKHYKAIVHTLKCTGTITIGEYCIVMFQQMITFTCRIIMKSSKLEIKLC